MKTDIQVKAATERKDAGAENQGSDVEMGVESPLEILAHAFPIITLDLRY